MLGVVQKALGASGAAALLESEFDGAVSFVEHVRLSAKHRRELAAFLPTVFEFSPSGGKRRRAPRSHGTIFVFSEADAKERGASSLIVYYLVHDKKLVGTLVLCSARGKFETQHLRLLDQIAGLLSLVVATRFYKDLARDADGLMNLDGLTGLHNHRYFQETLSNELVKSQRFDHAISLLLIDVDHFKQINDKYGHPRGDVILKELAEILRRTIRSYDLAARYGGEEFAVILPHADASQAQEVAERTRKAVQAHSFPGATARQKLKLTISVGVASSPNNAKTKAELVDRADQALYLAKSEGRNRVSLSLANSKELIKIGFCPPALKSAYYRDILAGMDDVVREIKQIELVSLSAAKESDYAALPRLFDRFVEANVDAVAICTQSPTAVRDLEVLHEAKIPVFFFNVAQPIPDRRIRSYVGYDQIEAGKTAGRYLGRVLRGRGNIAIIEGLPEPTSRLRVDGFKRSVSGFPEMKVVASVSGDWLARRAKDVTRKLLRAHEDLDAIFAVNDSMALGAAEAVKASGKLGKIFVVGLDGTRDALEAVRDGTLTATVDTRPRDMGRILLRTIVRGLIREEKVKKKIESPIAIVTAENVDHL